MLTPVEEIHEALREAYVPEYYASLNRQQRYAFGERWDEEDGGGLDAGGDFPDFPLRHVRHLAVGQSRRILTTSFVDLARNMYSPGDPMFPQVDKYTAEVRRQYWHLRAEEGDWDTARAQAFMEGNGLGVGVLQIGFERNPATGRMRTSVRHSPTLHTLWDPHHPSMGRAGYVCFVQTLPLNRAVALFGERMEAYVEHDQAEPGHRLRTVRIFEYYDLGHGRWDATRCVIPQRMTNDPIVRERSPWATRLPVAFYEHLLAPGIFRPVGRIPMQMPTQEALNEIEAHLRACARARPVDVWDSTFIDPTDFAQVQAGKSGVVRSIKPLAAGQVPLTRIPAEEISGSAMGYLQYLQAEFNEASGTNEYDRASRPDGDITATEVNEIQAKSARQSGWSDKQTDKFAVRTVIAVLDAAALGDTDPMTLDVFGTNVPINDPKQPDSALAGFLEEPSRTLIREGSLQYSDAQREGAQRLGQLQALQPLVGATVSVERFTEETLRAIGEEDPRSWMQAPPAPAGPTGPGAPNVPSAPGAPMPQAPIPGAPATPPMPPQGATISAA